MDIGNIKQIRFTYYKYSGKNKNDVGHIKNKPFTFNFKDKGVKKVSTQTYNKWYINLFGYCFSLDYTVFNYYTIKKWNYLNSMTTS